MPDNRNRKRPIQVKFFVDEKELAAIRQRMMESGADNLSPIFAPWLWRELSQLPMAGKSPNRENRKKRDCLIPIFYEEQRQIKAVTHTCAIQPTGILIFSAPILYCLYGLRFRKVILCAAAFISACEELVLIKSEKPNRDCKTYRLSDCCNRKIKAKLKGLPSAIHRQQALLAA